MDCRRAEELISDEVDGALVEPLLSELREHLASCPACTRLRNDVARVREHLATSPVFDAPPALQARVLGAVRDASSRARAFGPRLPRSIQVAAALLTVATTAGLVYGARGNSGRAARRYWERGVQTGAWVMERRDRMMEDLRLVRTVITMAFEGRVDRMSDRVDDYRRALEKQQEQTKGKNKEMRVDPKVISELGEVRTRKNL